MPKPEVDRLEHLSLVAYFAATPKRIGTVVSACARIALDVVGDVKVRGGAYPREPVPKYGKGGKLAASKAHLSVGGVKVGGWRLEGVLGLRCNLSRVANKHTVERLNSFDVGHVIIQHIPPDAIDRTFDALWTLSLHASPIHLGVRCDAQGVMNFNLHRLTEEQRTVLADVVRRFYAVMAATDMCFYGLADVGDVSETGSGLYYSTPFLQNVRFHRHLNHHAWIRAGERRRQLVRGAYWGNFLGPEVVTRLGGAPRLVEDFCCNGAARRGQPGFHEVYPDGSVFLSLSDNVSDMMSRPIPIAPVALSNAVWLHQRFYEAGVLCG